MRSGAEASLQMIETVSLEHVARDARRAAIALATISSTVKDAVLTDIAARLIEEADLILAANGEDVAKAEAAGMDASLVDRLQLTPERLQGMTADVRGIAALPDPIGEEFDARRLPNGIELKRRCVPLGVIGVIYESRPNVTIDVSALCLKSGNAVILRPGKESLRSSGALADLVRRALEANCAPGDAVQMVRDPDRALVAEMLRMRGQIDLIVPRGGKGLIETVRAQSQIPVVAGGIGVCHTYVHADADVEMAVSIVNNAKTRRPSVCNTLDTVLVHANVAPAFLPALAERWAGVPVEMRCDPRALALLTASGTPSRAIPAEPEDFGTEFLALRAAVKVVDDLDEAISHIEEYGSGHSEAIVTQGWEAAREFVDRIDAAAVFVNASTGFHDGAQFGLGAELGISTQKFHARGPLGLRELTSYKWVVLGDGQIRK
jgi:glutamate-5-semialdehyde dehydrogenase